jgi:selenocysteine lyase/cysteine desulfurase
MSNNVAEALTMRRGIGIRSGCHCAHILVKHILKVSPALERFQRIIFNVFRGLRPPGVARISFGIENSSGDVDVFLGTLASIADKNLPEKGDIKKQIKDFVRESALKVYS